MPMFTAILFTVAKICPETEQWIKKLWCIHSIECYPALKDKENLSIVTAWMNLVDIISVTEGQIKHDTTSMRFTTLKHRSKEHSSGCQGLRVRRMGNFSMGTKWQLC